MGLPLFWEDLHGLLLFADFFKNPTFLKKNNSRIPSECQAVRIQTMPDVLLGLIWVQTVCKGNQQTAVGGNELMVKRYENEETV